MPDSLVSFGPFRVDRSAGRLLRDGQHLALRPKTWSVLCFLIDNPGRLISKDELIDSVWNGRAVSDTMPGVSIAELRQALADDARSPRYIETAHGRGFRFIAEIREAPTHAADVPLERSALGAIPVPAEPAKCFVGRATELAALLAFVDRSADRARIMLIGGEAGIGKTTLADTLITEIEHRPDGASKPSFKIGRGQCPPHFGETYRFLPILGALAEICRLNTGARAILRQLAPSWSARLPRRDDGSSSAAPGDLVIDELVIFLQELGPTLLLFEDLHWADHATLDAIIVLAEHPALEHCRVVATYRPADAVANAHPLTRSRREWLRRERAVELVLEGLDEASIREYLEARFPGGPLPVGLAGELLARTCGNPFFLSATVDYLVASGALRSTPEDGTIVSERFEQIASGIPDSLRELVRQRFDEMDEPRRRLLGAASVVGLEADAAAIAAALGESIAATDTACGELARAYSFLSRTGESVWPDGCVSGRYAFRHPLYQRVLYDDVPPSVRRETHVRIAASLVAGFGQRKAEIATVVADHFDRGHAFSEAIDHYVLAADDALVRHGSSDAVANLRRALELSERDSGDATRQALILTRLAQALPCLHGFVGTDFGDLYARARSLAASDADLTQITQVLSGLCLSSLMQGKAGVAEELVRELSDLSSVHHQDATLRWYVGTLSATVLYYQGDLVGTLDHVERGLVAAPLAASFGPIDPRISLWSFGAAALWQAGRPAEGRQYVAAAVAESANAHPLNLTFAVQAEAVLHHWCGEVDGCIAAAARLHSHAEEQGVGEVIALAQILAAWGHSARGNHDAALQGVESGMTTLRSNGAMLNHVYLLATAAEVFLAGGHTESATETLDEAEALIERGGARFWEPELYRWRGEILCRRGGREDEAEALFDKALTLAEQQGSGSLILRSGLGLARLYEKTNRSAAAQTLTKRALRRVERGDGTVDVEQARAFLSTVGA